MHWARALRETGLVVAVGAFQVFSALAGGERAAAVPLDAVGIGLLVIGPLLLPLRQRAPVLVVAVAVLAGVVYFPLGYPGAAIFATVVVAVVSMRRRQVAEQRQGLQAEQARRATEERLAIARDLHDVLAHSLSVVQVQAGVALHLLDRQPEQTRAALTAIKSASDDGMRELRLAVNALRRDDDAPGGPLSPSPGLDDVSTLVAGAEASGLAVEVVRSGPARPVPPAVSLVGYRLVQEALTNVIRHSGATWCEVRIDAGDRLSVAVADNGRAGPDACAAEGNGLRGMRERVRAVGGTVEADALPGGGFRVRAELPL